MGIVVEIPGTAAATWREGVADEASLPTSGNTPMDVRASLDDETLFIWNGSAWIQIGGGQVFSNPNFTGTVSFFSHLMDITDGSDRIVLDSAVYQIKTAGHSRVYIADNHPQLTLQNADLWMEPGDASAPQGSIAAFNASTSDIGYSTIQQGDIPGFRPFRHIALSGALWFVPASERSSVTIASSTVPNAVFNGTIAGANANLTWNNWKAFKINDGAARYVETYLGASSLFFQQMNLDFELNYDAGHGKLIIADENAASNGKRLKSFTLSGGTVVEANDSITAKSVIFSGALNSGSAALTNQGNLSFKLNAGVGFTVYSTNASDANTYYYLVVENGR